MLKKAKRREKRKIMNKTGESCVVCGKFVEGFRYCYVSFAGVNKAVEPCLCSNKCGDKLFKYEKNKDRYTKNSK